MEEVFSVDEHSIDDRSANPKSKFMQIEEPMLSTDEVVVNDGAVTRADYLHTEPSS